MHRPAEGSVPLRSRDAIRIGSKAFYFLLPLAQLQRMHGQGADAAKENPPPFKTSQLLEKVRAISVHMQPRQRVTWHVRGGCAGVFGS